MTRIVLGIAFLILFLNAANAQLNKSDTLEILQMEEIVENTAEAHDLQIMRDSMTYKVRFYLSFNDTLRTHNASLVVEEDYTHASYQWATKNRAVITLFNPLSNSELKFNVWGRDQCTTGVKILD